MLVLLSPAKSLDVDSPLPSRRHTQPRMLDEAAELTRRLADPDAVGDQAEFRRASRRYAALAPVVACHEEVQALARDLAAARELGAEDASFAQEAVELEHRLTEAQDRLRLLLLPRDPDDDRDVFLEVKAGEGGEESALFAGDLARMYLRYAERVGWRTEIVDASPSDLGTSVRIQGANPGADWMAAFRAWLIEEVGRFQQDVVGW